MISKSTLSKNIPSLSTVWIMVAAFLCYTGMYAVRKSFLAGQYLHIDLGFDMDTKTVFVISQVLGYMCSKFLGIKIISEMSQKKRGYWLCSLVGFALLMLLAFAYLPADYKIIALFLNGLPLGMVFGVVFSYLEGRKNTELLAAGLSATFIFSTGFVKSIGLMLMQRFDIPEVFMPFATGMIFFPLFLIAVFMLQKSNDPTHEDIAERSERVPMNREKRKKFINQHGIGFAGLVVIYVLLTVIRDFRDNFIVEFWVELGHSQEPGLITLTEVPVAIIVLIIASLGILIRNNQLAFNWGMGLTALGAVIVLVVTLLFVSDWVSPAFWVISTGVGVYLPYILFHCLIFERLIAVLRVHGNVGYLFYTADAMGYLGSVLILLGKGLISNQVSWVDFFVNLNISLGTATIIITVLSLLYFRRVTKRRNLANVDYVEGRND